LPIVALFKLQLIVTQPFAENTYLAHAGDDRACLVVDPGLEPELILEQLERLQLIPAAILNTHGHADHIGGNAALKQQWPQCPLVIGAGDAPKLSDPRLNLSANYGLGLVSPEADVLVREGDVYSAAGIDLEVLETPGHSCGHVVFVYKGAADPANADSSAADQPWIVFGGDVLFHGSIGRSDFPDGDFNQLVRSIHDKLFTMPDDTIILPGHGDPTTVGVEKEHNPFVGRRALPRNESSP
jgi:glyoxylase-like metal-dependent hydrolase (beta-lactamase superfamily II)